MWDLLGCKILLFYETLLKLQIYYRYSEQQNRTKVNMKNQNNVMLNFLQYDFREMQRLLPDVRPRLLCFAIRSCRIHSA